MQMETSRVVPPPPVSWGDGCYQLSSQCLIGPCAREPVHCWKIFWTGPGSRAAARWISVPSSEHGTHSHPLGVLTRPWKGQPGPQDWLITWLDAQPYPCVFNRVIFLLFFWHVSILDVTKKKTSLPLQYLKNCSVLSWDGLCTANICWATAWLIINSSFTCLPARNTNRPAASIGRCVFSKPCLGTQALHCEPSCILLQAAWIFPHASKSQLSATSENSLPSHKQTLSRQLFLSYQTIRLKKKKSGLY